MAKTLNEMAGEHLNRLVKEALCDQALANLQLRAENLALAEQVKALTPLPVPAPEGGT